ncbi:hypothetical protein FCM35_KLT03521 [Carex littledalei]|uniref:Uncharacterized protein n=1 Tax=Carex littledalei TaxID=544730 RepID=A0A833VM15_9POAL|nr:hypothetical protein FCM35_KLT03521 [Carex littledalei]
MSKKSLAILMRARMRGGSAAVPSPLSLPHEQPHAPLSSPHDPTGNSDCAESSGSLGFVAIPMSNIGHV